MMVVVVVDVIVVLFRCTRHVHLLAEMRNLDLARGQGKVTGTALVVTVRLDLTVADPSGVTARLRPIVTAPLL